MQALGIDLPRKDENGINYISYSQYTSFKSDKSYNLQIHGYQEYILSYFLGERWPDSGYAQFGQDVEDYICEKKGAEKFSASERETLDRVEPLGVFQREVKLWLGSDLYLLGYIDDSTEDMTRIRDYKTGSLNSCKKYHTPDYEQLNFYSAYVKQETGKLPEHAEVVAIQRFGSCHGLIDRRDKLSVGTEIWPINRTPTEEEVEKSINNLLKVVFQISDFYKVFKQM